MTGMFLGVDGGQTSTLAVVCDETGNLLGTGLAGPSNHIHEPGGMERFERALRTSIGAALQAAGFSDPPKQPIELAAACCGMTGGWERVHDVLAQFVTVQHLIAEPDMVTAHAGAFGGGPGVIVIAGTGSIAYGKDAAGQQARSGGWGYAMGDEGSGYDIGRQALMAAARMEDGRGPHTSLLAALLDHFQMASLWEVRTALYGGKISRPQIAALAPLVFQACRQGDEAAQWIVDQAACHLAQLATAVLGRLCWEEPAYVTPVGGVFQAGETIMNPFQTKLKARCPDARVVPTRYPPVIGALLLAYRAGQVSIDVEQLEAITQKIQRKG